MRVMTRAEGERAIAMAECPYGVGQVYEAGWWLRGWETAGRWALEMPYVGVVLDWLGGEGPTAAMKRYWLRGWSDRGVCLLLERMAAVMVDQAERGR